MQKYDLKEKEFDEEKLLQDHLLDKYRDKMSKKLPEGFAETLEELPWESILELAEDYKKRMKEKTQEIKDIQRKLAFALLIIREHLKKHKSGSVGFDIKFVKSLMRLMEKTYKLSIQYEVDLDEFLLLITIIIEKMKKEKLTPYQRESSHKQKEQPFEKIDTKLDLSKPDEDDDEDEDE
ncbi:hypothetical protein KO465_06425 [Candidatus Micrarchaeota archaeon]|nr:hypothetical protein [Candidatus Micrarchaeota archaeon]